MFRSLNVRDLFVPCVAVFAFTGLGIGWVAASGASPEDETARLNRVRADLFAELVKTRAEAAATKAEFNSDRARADKEIARLDRNRANLFEELVRARAEATAARAGLDAATEAHAQAEAELSRLKQEATVSLPAAPVQDQVPDVIAPSLQSSPTDSTKNTSAKPPVPPLAPITTGSLPKKRTASAQSSTIRVSAPERAAAKPEKRAPHDVTASPTRQQQLPSVLRLQDPQ